MSGKYPGGVSGDQSVDSFIADILNKTITSGMTDEQKVKAIYDYLIYNFEHDDNAAPILFGTGYDSAYTFDDTVALAMPIIATGKGTCDAFANIFRLLAIRLGFECNYVSGQYINSDGTKAGHGWNQIMINNEWY